MTYCQIEDKIYYINLNNLYSFVSQTPSSEKMINTTITQYYKGDECEDNGKEIVESKSSLNDTMNNMRYDMAKYLISVLFSERISPDGRFENIIAIKDLSFSQRIVFNTLIEHKILSEKEND